MNCAALIVAAGRGSRAGQDGGPKQYRPLGGPAILTRTLSAFLAHPGVDRVLTVIHPDDVALYGDAARGLHSPKLAEPVHGGATRQQSVRAGLEALDAAAPATVLIHDAARPLTSADTIGRVLSAIAPNGGAIAAIPLSDTLKREGPSATAAATLERKGLWRAQTPQGFPFAEILSAHRRAARECAGEFTDDAAIAEWAGLTVRLVLGAESNLKITTTGDFEIARRLMADHTAAFEPRTGTGFDVHRFTAGDHVWLCGVRIPHSNSLEGHSDADVALHALTDAILGALGDGDIGAHFPPSDPQWKGAPSKLFLADAVRRVAGRGGRISNADITLLCEAPRIGPYRNEMCAAIAAILGIEPNRIGVKATTTEGLGFTGRREGIAALASATILLPG